MAWSQFGVLICAGAGFVLFVSRNWRWNLIALALVYVGIFLLLYEQLPLEQSAIVLVGGWMGVAVLGATRQGEDDESRSDESQDAGVLFRIILFALFLLVAWTNAEGARSWLPDNTFESAFSGILLAGTGMVRTGIVSEPLQIVLSFLAILAGFECVFSFVESSALMTALLAIADLGLSVTGAYLVSYTLRPSEEEGL